MGAGRNHEKEGGAVMNIFEAIKRKRRVKRWEEYGLSEATVEAYLKRNDSVELNVPLQIVRGLVEELESEMVMTKAEDAMSLAEKSGALKAYYKVAMRMREVNKRKIEVGE